MCPDPVTQEFYLFQQFTNSEANFLLLCQEAKLADFTEIKYVTQLLMIKNVDLRDRNRK